MLEKTKVSEILKDKGKAIVSVDPGATVFEALSLMAERNTGAVLVMSEGRLEGLLSERDYARKVVLRGRNSRETHVREIMSRELIIVHPEDSVMESLAIMTEKRIRHLPVMEGSEVVGLISIGDLVKRVIDEQHIMIKHLENYISGSYMA
ncbi:MAG TPA: CBS domain-containing protein [Leptospiraceae bacterium]|jgi:CBS domain-containing protein|nr:CBS domain-containing protein [Leptospirales bacterium]HMU84163.1 CBS domain-containing protein [Leptospiraceae bacterium]HMX55089.1 CBS domain-containing protein [Leptospiraceae bacterium]HMY46261.1 CBS domain-containing protein [Leptospiraceae bacterium]HMZ36942.1 CBS domain-containing protein [Leptospiraceae bacterium]